MSLGIAPHDYADITVRGIIGKFFKTLEDELSRSFAFRIGVPIPSNQNVETYKWLGHAQQLRRWMGGRLLRGLPIRSYTLENKIYEDTLGVDIEDWRYDKTGQLAIRFAELAKRGVTHWDKLATDALQTNGNAWDGVPLYSANHVMGGGAPATQRNDLTAAQIPALTVADTSNLTVDEATKIILQVFPYFYQFKDNAGEPYNDGMRQVAIVVPPQHMGPFLAALRVMRVEGGSSSPLSVLAWNIEIIPNSRLSTAPTVLYFFRTDSPMKALILQAVFKGAANRAPDGSFDLSSDLELQFLGEGSETAFHRNQYVFGLKAVRTVGYGEWAHTLRATLST